MKKLICLLFVLLTVTLPALADEIRFRGIPWGSNVQTVISALGWDEELARRNELIEQAGNTIQTDDPLVYYLLSNRVREVGYSVFDNKIENENCGYTYNNFYSLKDEMIVAEHSVDTITLEFLYGVEDGNVLEDQTSSEFVKGTYKFMGDDIGIYEDILDKLIWIYGEPIDFSETIEDYPSSKIKEVVATWEGENDTVLLLTLMARGEYSAETYEYIYSISNLSLEYGKTDIGERISAIVSIMEKNERDVKYNDINTYGLQ